MPGLESYSMKIKTTIKGKINRGLTVTFVSLLTAYDEQGTSTHLLNQLLSYTHNFQRDWQSNKGYIKNSVHIISNVRRTVQLCSSKTTSIFTGGIW